MASLICGAFFGRMSAVQAEGGIPPIPATYGGYVYVGGLKAGAGLTVSAQVGNWTTPSVNMDTTDSNGYYDILTVGPPEGVTGQIDFYVNGVKASETDAFVAGSSNFYFDLHITALPTPTPTTTATTPTPTLTSTPTPTAIPITSNASTSIGASGGTVNTSDGTITITFPAGAFTASTNVSIQGGACQGNTSGGFAVGGTCFNVTPDGALSANATICVNLSAADLLLGLNTNTRITLGYWFNGSWVEAGNVTRNGTILCGTTNHLSSWAVLGATVNGTPAATPTPSTTPTSAATSTPSTTPTSAPSSTPTPTHTPSKTNGGGTNWALIGGIAGGVILLVVIFIAVNSRSRSGGKNSSKAKPKK